MFLPKKVPDFLERLISLSHDALADHLVSALEQQKEDAVASNMKDPGKNIFNSSIEWLTNILALIAAFFGGPELYMRSLRFVLRFAESRYGPGFEDVVQLVWFVLMLGLVFFTARLALAYALIALSGTIALRLFAA